MSTDNNKQRAALFTKARFIHEYAEAGLGVVDYLCSMYYRRKLLLALLQVFDNHLDRLAFQKLLFLVTRYQQHKAYDFVPYMYGCYSFQAVSDLGTLKKYRKIIDGDEGFQNISMEDYLAQLKQEDKSAILKVKAAFGGKANDELTRLTYLSYPYYAINSMMAERLLTSEEFDKVKRTRPIKHKSILFTIGYEGKTVESYLNSLIVNDIRVLCDVRNNPVSMKFGFSKTQLQKFCEALGIKYIHLPEVGIQSEKRQELHNQNDYNNLFKEYKATTLQKTSQIQSYILFLLSDNERIALTCFEANVCQCHRKPLAEAIAALPGWHYELSHI